MITPARLAFVFATSMEAAPLVDAIDAKQISCEPWPLYHAVISDQPAIIIITGMGMEAAGNATEFIITNCAVTAIINCGVAGSLSDQFGIGDIVNINESRISQDGEIDETVCQLSSHSHSLSAYADGALLTVNQPVFDPVQKEILSAVTQLVDMEGGAVARICERHNVPCQLLKIISDNATKQNQLKNNLDQVSEKLARTVALDTGRLYNQEMTA